MVRHYDKGTYHINTRGCTNKDVFEKNKQECRFECTTTMCEESGCKEELLAKSTMYDLYKKSTRVHSTLAYR